MRFLFLVMLVIAAFSFVSGTADNKADVTYSEGFSNVDSYSIANLK